ncbi:MAG: long-chain fatty acid--CoA ligase [Alphaproteobacteria bacterium]|nr:MAG: long-chain fatty acid--CoA ligase [Alphaproteobacteria bacterium]
MTIDRWIEAAAQARPDKPAILFEGAALSYGDLAREIGARAEALRRAGVSRGDRVAWYGLNEPEVFVLLFACARLGAILVPLNWRLAEAEIAQIVEDCDPALVIHDAAFADAARRLTGRPVVAAGAALPEGSPARAEVAGEDDPLLIVYTSGSTGRPKGAVLRQSALVANAAMSVEAHGMRPEDTVLNVLPLFHVGGLNILCTPALSIGATVELHRRFEPAAMAQALSRVDLAITVPTVLQAVMETPEWAAADLRRLRAISIGSTDVPVPLIEAVHARGVPVIQIYGATETSPLAIYQRVEEAYETVGSIGRAGSACEIRLVTGDGSDAAPGESGEIWVKGPNTLAEYWRAPEETAAAIRDGWFRTGDVAMRDEAGLYWFRDRIKHVIISGGENIYPAEIERVLRDHPGIREVAVVGRPDPKWGELPVAVVARADPSLTAESVLGHLEGRIARYKRPREVVFVDALPRNAMGKVVAAEVRRMIAAKRAAEAGEA